MANDNTTTGAGTIGTLFEALRTINENIIAVSQDLGVLLERADRFEDDLRRCGAELKRRGAVSGSTGENA